VIFVLRSLTYNRSIPTEMDSVIPVTSVPNRRTQPKMILMVMGSVTSAITAQKLITLSREIEIRIALEIYVMTVPIFPAQSKSVAELRMWAWPYRPQIQDNKPKVQLSSDSWSHLLTVEGNP